MDNPEALATVCQEIDNEERSNYEWDLERLADADAHEIVLSESDLQLLQQEGVIYTQTLAGKGMTLRLDRPAQ